MTIKIEDITLEELKQQYHDNPHDYMQEANDGEAIWDKFVSKHNNISCIFFLLLSKVLNYPLIF